MGGLSEQLAGARGAEHTCVRTHVCGRAVPGVLEGAACWAESGSQARSPPAMLRRAGHAGALGAGGGGAGRGGRSSEARAWSGPRTQHGVAWWPRCRGRGWWALGRRAMWTRAPPHWSAVRRGHSPGASLWLGALTGATGGPGEPSRLPLHGRPGAPFRREGGMRAPSSDTQRPPHRTGRGSPRGPSFRLPVRSPGQGPGGQEGRGEPRGCAAAPSPPWEAVRVRRPLPRPGPQMARPGVSKNSC